MKAKKIDLLRLCLVQFDVKPICEKFKVSELECYHILSTRYLNKFTRNELLQFAESPNFYNTLLAIDLFELGADPNKQFGPYFYKYLSKAYKDFNLKMLRDCFKESK